LEVKGQDAVKRLVGQVGKQYTGRGTAFQEQGHQEALEQARKAMDLRPFTARGCEVRVVSVAFGME